MFVETNPCTEFWFLLHFLPNVVCRRYESYEQLLPELQKYMPGYEKTKRYFIRTNLYKFLTENGDLERAMSNSEKLCLLCQESPEDLKAYSCPVYFTDKARFCGIRGTSVIRDKGLVIRSVEHNKDFGLLLLQPLVLAQGVEHPLAEQLRAIGVDTEAEKNDGLQIVVGNVSLILLLRDGCLALVQDARLEDRAHIGIYRLDEHSEQASKLVLGEPYVAVLQLDADCGVAVDVLQPGDGDVSSV